MNPPCVARIISLRARPEDLSTLLDIYRTSSVPMVADLPGLLMIAGMASSQSGQAVSITVWETPEDRERGGISAESAVNLNLYAPLMVGSYQRDAYDVPVFELRIGSASSLGMLLGRITTEDIEPAHWDAATASLKQVAQSLVASTEDGYGVMLFESHAMSRALLIELAVAQPLLDARALATREHRTTARSQHLLRRPSTTETFDVVDIM